MKQGKTLLELAHALEDEQKRKLDVIADTRTTTLELTDEGPVLDVDDVGQFGVTPFATRQICSRLKVPARFWDLMAGGTTREKAALTEVVNARLHDHPEPRMVRALAGGETYQGEVRAFLSARYRRLDSLDLLMHALPVLQAAGPMHVASCEATSKRMYLKVSFDDLVAEPVVGDPVRFALCLSNSEVGDGSLRVEKMLERLICRNGMTIGTAMRRYHVGREQDAGILSILSDESLKADDDAFWMKLRDVITAALDESGFEDAVAALSESATRAVDNVPAAVEVLGQRLKLSDDERAGVLSELITGDELLDRNGLRATQYGLIQALTAFSQRDEVTYTRASEIESLAGNVLEMKPAEWRAVAMAA